jgi:endonuclease YncB( thermonuclease family)
MADSWAEFPDATEGDPWADFPDAEPQARRKRQAPPVKARAETAPTVIDGDTVRLENGVLRLWGADAPELAQQGWDREGAAVPVGQQSRNAMLDLMGGGQPLAGPPVGASYGRSVGPLSIGGVDAGEQMIRSGNALAAPSFVASDPDYRFRLMQAERLARQNQLGPVHDNFVQPPAEYREAPAALAPTETVAQFFDTPTPLGLPPEVERELTSLIYSANVPLEEADAFAREHGGYLDLEKAEAARSHFLKTGEKPSLAYEAGPVLLTDSGDGAPGAAVRGFGSGFVAGGLDELGAFPDMVGLTPGRESVWNSERRLADIWQNNQQQNASILGYDEQAHPYASGAGNVAGAVTSGFVIPYGTGARTVGQLARVGAVYGGVEGALGTDGGLTERAEGAAIGAPVGAAINAVGGKALQLAAPVVARGIRAVSGRAAPKAAEATGEAGLGYAEDSASNAAQRAAQGQSADEWADFPDAPEVRGVAAMDAEPMPSISGAARQRDYIDVSPPVRPQRMDQPLTEAQTRAIAENIEPRDVVPIPSNEVASVEEAASAQAGRIVPAKAPHELGALTSRTVRNFMGAEVPKVGPVDLVGFVRLKGGIDDAGDAVSRGGDLKAMGFTNASRKGLDFVGQEHRFGPLVREGGMSLDEAAHSAWEAGYFPELAERPTINQFLETLDETHRGGSGRRFLPEDQPEIETYYGRQAERHDLEQEQIAAGGPVYVDRSAPGDENAPFAPPEAYEEWPAEAVSRAGNINLDRLESPQDIRRALVQTSNRVGFDAATRGRVTHAETERLAAELNLTADQLLTRRKGQALNAEEALAARQLLAKSGNELVNAAKNVQALDDPGDEVLAEFRRKWVRHVAIQEQVAGATAEAGRVLQQFRMAASSRAVRGDILSSLVRGGGGKDGLKNAAETLIDAVESGPGVFNALAEKAVKPKFRHKLAELYINMLLSGPQTHAVNIASNTLTSMAQIPEHAAAALIGGARQAFSRQALDRVTATEVGARAFGLLQGAKEGARLFARSLRTGDASDLVTKIEGDEYKAISGIKGEVIRIPTRLLTAEDELFKGIARRMELNARAVRIARSEGLKGEARRARIAELVADPTDGMIEHSMEYGRYLTFQRKLGPVGTKVSGITNDNLLAKVFLPFVRTPTNLLKFAVERSPAAPILREWRKDFAAGGESRDLAVARAMLGTGFGFAIYEAALAGHVSGSAPSDPKKARLLYADGWKPYSIRLGDKWYSYRRFDPFSTTIGVAADLATLPEGMSERQRNDKATLLVASILGNLASKTWLSGLSDLIGALDDPERNAGNLLERLAGSFTVPTGVNQVARLIDPVQRETGSVGEAIQSRIPGLSEGLLPRRDIWGREIVNEGGVGPDIISPVWQSTALDDPVNRELMQLDYAPGYPSKQVGGETLSPENYDRYLEASGKAVHAELGELIASQEWRDMDDTSRIKAAKGIVREVRAEVRGSLFSGEQASADSWDDFEDADDGTALSDTWNLFPDAEQRDVIGSIEQAIPGVRFTSGYRTPEYQADMRARGYKPADNSGHLDGSDLDMLPPPGKSLGWLRREVAKVEPDAKFLIHDGHLHASFLTGRVRLSLAMRENSWGRGDAAGGCGICRAR